MTRRRALDLRARGRGGLDPGPKGPTALHLPRPATKQVRRYRDEGEAAGLGSAGPSAEGALYLCGWSRTASLGAGAWRLDRYAVLRRVGCTRRDWLQPRVSREVVRYERGRPGELLPLDVKKWGASPGRRQALRHGRQRSEGKDGDGLDYTHVALATVRAAPASRRCRALASGSSVGGTGHGD